MHKLILKSYNPRFCEVTVVPLCKVVNFFHSALPICLIFLTTQVVFIYWFCASFSNVYYLIALRIICMSTLQPHDYLSAYVFWYHLVLIHCSAIHRMNEWKFHRMLCNWHQIIFPLFVKAVIWERRIVQFYLSQLVSWLIHLSQEYTFSALVLAKCLARCGPCSTFVPHILCWLCGLKHTIGYCNNYRTLIVFMLKLFLSLYSSWH